MGKLTTYPSAQKIQDSDILIVDGASGTRKITVKELAAILPGELSMMNRRALYRGKNLGSTVTAAQKTAIQSGSFDDLFVGDYWKINDIAYRIADINYYWNTGDPKFLQNHLVIVPDTILYRAPMNDEDVTTGGYVGSKMYTEGLAQAKTTITEAFGDLVLTHRDTLINSVSDDGLSTGWAWYDSTVELMTEVMVFGCYTFGKDGYKYAGYLSNHQLALFVLHPIRINVNVSYWLRDFDKYKQFMCVSGNGMASRQVPTWNGGVRPVFTIGL